LKILGEAFLKAKTARFQILDLIEKEIAAPRAKISPNAPEILMMKVKKPDQIGLIIGLRRQNHQRDPRRDARGRHHYRRRWLGLHNRQGRYGREAREIIANMTKRIFAGEEIRRRSNTAYGLRLLRQDRSECGRHGSCLGDGPIPRRTGRDLRKGRRQSAGSLVKEIDEKGRINLSVKQANPAFFVQEAGDAKPFGGGGLAQGENGGRPPQRSSRKGWKIM